MQIEPSALAREARREPVKNAFRIGLEFLDQNRLLAAMTMGAFIVLTLLEVIPLIGLFAGIAVGVLSQSVQFYVGRSFYASENMGAFVQRAQEATLMEFLTRHWRPAFGAWLGWFVVGMLMVLLFFILIMAAGMNLQSLEALAEGGGGENMLVGLGGAGIVVMVCILLLSYVYPAVQGRVMLSESFGEAFQAVFSLFSPALWRRTLHGGYFSFAFFLGLAMLGIVLLVGATMALLMLIPILGAVLGVVWLMFLLYAFILIFSVVCMLAISIAMEEPSDAS